MDHDRNEPNNGAERQRRYRRRKCDGAVAIRLEVSAVMSEALIEAGWLNAIDAENSVAVAEALAQLHDWWLAR